MKSQMARYAVPGQKVKLCYMVRRPHLMHETYREEIALVEPPKTQNDKVRELVTVRWLSFNKNGVCQQNIDNGDDWLYWIEKIC